ncbi:hypothetical protein [Hymenobacter negativus]|uniref:Uncharacterized protein n=1 Tax=Hymenobacter negativus TaxID=2795026 RepID=A0ABS0Q8J9_9BACT|nr:hypothetical protein [Hymenobacter negativus]MBH8558981.1 hypothetical protein [Hymenobacter negativus]
MKKLLLLGACLLALSMNPVRAYASDPDIVVVRVFDNGGSARVVISRAGGKNEVSSFNSGNGEKGLSDSGQGYLKVVQKLYSEGYSLKSTFTADVFLTTLIFVKEAPKP